jgi:hypothetical protein
MAWIQQAISDFFEAGKMSDQIQQPEDRLAAVQKKEPEVPSAFHLGNFMEFGKPGVQKANNLDAISQLELPSSWARFDQKGLRSNSTTFRPGNHASTEIGLIERNRPIAEKSAATFNKLVNGELSTPHNLYSDKAGSSPADVETFKALSDALGSTTVGDNQLSCPQTSADCRRPAFHMDSARVETINGRNVIAVDGWFTQLSDSAQVITGADGPAKRYYSGIFFEAGARGSKVDELYVTADDKRSYLNNKAAYQSVLQSIKWR